MNYSTQPRTQSPATQISDRRFSKARSRIAKTVLERLQLDDRPAKAREAHMRAKAREAHMRAKGFRGGDFKSFPPAKRSAQFSKAGKQASDPPWISAFLPHAPPHDFVGLTKRKP